MNAHRPSGGAWVLVCGPSGAGKDSVIGWAREQLASHTGIVFAQRIVTRPGPRNADNEPVGDEALGLLQRSGGLAWHWQAHGFGYGIATRYARQVAWGRVVVVNGSREHVAAQLAAQMAAPVTAQAAARAFAPSIRTVEITAGAAQLAARLAARAREAPQAIAVRMERNQRLASQPADLVITNDGSLPDAGRRLQQFLLSQLSQATSAPGPQGAGADNY